VFGTTRAYDAANSGTEVARYRFVHDATPDLDLELFREVERAELRRLEARRVTTRGRPATTTGTPRR
jgi:hypothetical protein